MLAGAMTGPVEVKKAPARSSSPTPLSDAEVAPGKEMGFTTKIVDIMRAGGRAVASAGTAVGHALTGKTTSKSWLGRMFFGD